MRQYIEEPFAGSEYVYLKDVSFGDVLEGVSSAIIPNPVKDVLLEARAKGPTITRAELSDLLSKTGFKLSTIEGQSAWKNLFVEVLLDPAAFEKAVNEAPLLDTTKEALREARRQGPTISLEKWQGSIAAENNNPKMKAGWEKDFVKTKPDSLVFRADSFTDKIAKDVGDGTLTPKQAKSLLNAWNRIRVEVVEAPESAFTGEDVYEPVITRAEEYGFASKESVDSKKQIVVRIMDPRTAQHMNLALKT